ncbi:MAG: molybdate ABC transporter substrate-binding protein [Thermodesulfobacteriota bacterium]
MICAIASALVVSSAPVWHHAMANEGDSVTVFAAASLTGALTQISALFRQKGMGKVVNSYASSSTLAKQIEKGAPAHVFISADQDWMNYLAERKLVDTTTRFDLVGNRLVLIAPADSPATVRISPGFELARLLGDSRLATGDPDHVPAGKYAKAALEKLGVWSQVAGRLARASDVRGALALVERGEAPLGIVYGTDAAAAKKVKIVAEFPSDTYPRVVYPAALVSGRESATARGFVEFLKGPEARDIFLSLGFSVE